jgi:mevalonate kinase
LGSSAAYSVALAAALLKFYQHPTDLATINQCAFLFEKLVHGTPSGLDNTICTFGGVAVYKNKTLESIHHLSTFSFLLTNTLVLHNTKELVGHVKELMIKVILLDDLVSICGTSYYGIDRCYHKCIFRKIIRSTRTFACNCCI